MSTTDEQIVYLGVKIGEFAVRLDKLELLRAHEVDSDLAAIIARLDALDDLTRKQGNLIVKLLAAIGDLGPHMAEFERLAGFRDGRLDKHLDMLESQDARLDTLEQRIEKEKAAVDKCVGLLERLTNDVEAWVNLSDALAERVAELESVLSNEDENACTCGAASIELPHAGDCPQWVCPF